MAHKSYPHLLSDEFHTYIFESKQEKKCFSVSILCDYVFGNEHGKTWCRISAYGNSDPAEIYEADDLLIISIS
jgi:hypothetical protein